jgi:cobalt/nickel transport system permease protein
MPFDTPANASSGPPFFSFRAIRPDRKLLGAGVFSLGASLLTHPLPALAACGFAGILLLCSGIDRKAFGKRFISVNAFFLLLWLLLPLSAMPENGESVLFSCGPLVFHSSGIFLALLITLKGNAIAVALLALAGSSTIAENGRALLSLHVPDKLVALLLLTHSNLALMADEYSRLFQAARLRGFTPRTSPASYATYARLIALLLVRAWQHAQRVDEAMRLRGFSGRFPIIPSRCSCPPRMQARNRRAAFLLQAFCCSASVALLAWDRFL